MTYIVHRIQLNGFLNTRLLKCFWYSHYSELSFDMVEPSPQQLWVVLQTRTTGKLWYCKSGEI